MQYVKHLARRSARGDHRRHVVGAYSYALLPAAVVLAISGLLWLAVPRLVSAVQTEGAISGQILDDNGSAVGDVKVTLTRQGLTNSTLTQGDGKFEFRKLPLGAYTLSAEAPGFRREAVQLIIGRAGETITPTVKLKPSSLHVAVFDATNRQPLGGVSIALSNREHGAVGGTAAGRVVTDESGDAFFGRLQPGSYQLAASRRGYDDYHSIVFISAGRITTEFALPLSIAPVVPINERASQRYSVPNLPSKSVQCVFQDSEGWLWLGTDKGIARFNGADFKSSSASGSAYGALAGADVRAVTEDLQGTIWVGTSHGIQRVTKDGSSTEELLNGSDVRDIMVDSRGWVWIATGAGEYRYDSRGLTHFNQSRGLGSDDVRATTEDRGGTVLIATAAGAYTIKNDTVTPIDLATRSGARGAQALQGESTSTAEVATAATTPGVHPGDTARTRSGGPPVHMEPANLLDVRDVFVDRSGAAWFATAQGAVMIPALRPSNASGPGSEPTPPPDPALIQVGAAGVRSIGQDGSGRLWFGLDTAGALIYSPDRHETQRIGLVERDKVRSIFTDREGNVWFATDDGAVRADFYSFVDFNTSRGLADNDVKAVIEEPAKSAAGQGAEDRLWFATAAGISVMQGEGMVPLEGFRANLAVNTVAFDRDGSAWIGTDDGVFKLGGQALTQLNEGNGLPSDRVNCVTAVAGGAAMALATTKGLSISTGMKLTNADPLSNYDVRQIVEGDDGKLWCATDRGVVVFDIETGAADLIDNGRGLIDNDVRSIARSGQRMIVATRAGVQYSDMRPGPDRGREIFSPVTVDNGGASALFIDRDNYLWIGTDDGQVKKIASLEGQLISTAYSGETTALTSGRINSIYQDRQGRIWIATSAGVVRHIPDRLAPVALASGELDGKPLQYQSRASEGAGVFDVPYGAHKLTFYFTGVSMNGQVRFLYRLRSAAGNEPWVALPVQQAAEREVSLSEFGQGPYEFEIKAINRDLYGMQATGATISLRVGPPFWRRAWFYWLAFGAACISAAAFIIARRIRRREFVLPRELRNYLPVEPNPYIVGNPIRTERMFYGREDDFRYVRTKLEGVSQGVVIVFCGERRVGKSSILYQVLNGRLGGKFVPVFVDMQEMVIASDAEFFARTSRLIAEAISRADSPKAVGTAAGAVPEAGFQKLGKAQPASLGLGVAAATDQIIRVPPFDRGNPYPIFLDFLDEALRVLGDRTLLILVDEYELMEGKVDDGKLSQELFTFLAGLMDNKERLALIFTGSRRLEERDKKYWRELLRRSLFRKVGFFSEKDTMRLITEPVSGRAVFGRGVIELIYRLTAGQPFYTQVICQNTVDYLNENRRNWIVTADVARIIDDIVDNPLPQMIYTWEGLSDDEKIVLSLLAESLPDGVSFATAAEPRASVELNNYPVHLSETTIRLTLEEMFRREMLDKDIAGGFRFKMDLFRLWVRRSHSIWQVVNEVRTL
jgi:ligand-binding sensor domain-containing protein